MRFLKAIWLSRSTVAATAAILGAGFFWISNYTLQGAKAEFREAFKNKRPAHMIAGLKVDLDALTEKVSGPGSSVQGLDRIVVFTSDTCPFCVSQEAELCKFAERTSQADFRLTFLSIGETRMSARLAECARHGAASAVIDVLSVRDMERFVHLTGIAATPSVYVMSRDMRLLESWETRALPKMVLKRIGA